MCAPERLLRLPASCRSLATCSAARISSAWGRLGIVSGTRCMSPATTSGCSRRRTGLPATPYVMGSRAPSTGGREPSEPEAGTLRPQPRAEDPGEDLTRSARARHLHARRLPGPFQPFHSLGLAAEGQLRTDVV